MWTDNKRTRWNQKSDILHWFFDRNIQNVPAMCQKVDWKRKSERGKAGVNNISGLRNANACRHSTQLLPAQSKRLNTKEHYWSYKKKRSQCMNNLDVCFCLTWPPPSPMILWHIVATAYEFTSETMNSWKQFRVFHAFLMSSHLIGLSIKRISAPPRVGSKGFIMLIRDRTKRLATYLLWCVYNNIFSLLKCYRQILLYTLW